MNHLAYTALFGVLIAAAIALEGERSKRERLYAGIYWFCSAMAFVTAGGWIMHWIHG